MTDRTELRPLDVLEPLKLTIQPGASSHLKTLAEFNQKLTRPSEPPNDTLEDI